ncbi:MAG: nitrate ABC transporter substrate-binding protein [Alcanivorax sp.]|nr:nitrate ABC transporter substrate-binding protein [Alcanivorax sp.]MAY09896.1 nitrate ABC transporter substrate-binding protein [Alcanivorax sp.]MBI55980.1 nitrate ABC transporter substrate-binding protein [Alcanivorax sp.]HCE38508.1 nitrate ABC transporter substrate-binding protein [Alcanivorax sp.]|tara:strand:- start:67 stop:1062 length:996 start_codon:yes stop_codon:yes gene_type:complete
MKLWTLTRAALAGALLGGALSAQADDLTPVTVSTTWYAQAEHGGLYAAKAMGLYEQHGLDVTIKMGGPQVNNMQLLLGGATDFSMSYSLQALNAVKQGLPLVTVAAFFQKDPQSLMVHEGQGYDEIADLKGAGIRIPTAGRVAYWPWLKAEYGFTDDQLRPYDYTIGPFIADPTIAQQGYITNDGYFLGKEDVDAKSLLLADAGWGAYSATLVTTRGMIDEQPEVVQAMVDATAEGWAAYFENPAPANALIKQDNPEMQDDLIAYSIGKMQEQDILLSDAAEDGAYGMMTDDRWQAFYQDMVEAGTLPEGLDYRKAYDLRFIQETWKSGDS